MIAQKEEMWLSLAWDRKRFTLDLAHAASHLLSVIAFSDHADPIDLSLLSDDAGSSDRQNSSQPDSTSKGSRGSKRKVEQDIPRGKKKVKRPNVIAQGTQVACLDKRHNAMWVLGRVSRYLPDLKKYEVLDDADGDQQTYRVFKKHIKVLPKKMPNFEPKKKVLAVYPGTTAFYPARLSALKGKNWMVEFDDEDESEEGRLKEVDGRYIIQE